LVFHYTLKLLLHHHQYLLYLLPLLLLQQDLQHLIQLHLLQFLQELLRAL
jgi:hypothetical protein